MKYLRAMEDKKKTETHNGHNYMVLSAYQINVGVSNSSSGNSVIIPPFA